MLSNQRPGSSSNTNDGSAGNNNSNSGGGDEEYEVREIHAVIPPPPGSARARRRESWENGSHRSSSLSVGSEVLSEQFTSMSREFNAMILAGSTMQQGNGRDSGGAGAAANPAGNGNLGRIGEEELEETNPLAIVPDGHTLDPVSPPRRLMAAEPAEHAVEEVSLQRVKKEEVESKISAWQTAKIAKVNNRFKREDVIINGWESEKVEKATALLKKVERKLDEMRARAIEKMQNDVAKAHRKAEEKKASAEAKRGTKVARILELANLMRAVGRAPSKRSFF